MSVSASGDKRRSLRRNVIVAIVLACFVFCWFLGSRHKDPSLDGFLARAYPEGTRFESVSADVLRAKGPNDETLGYVGRATASGYGGPLLVTVAVGADGEVRSLAVVEHRETPAFFKRAVDGRLLDGLVKRSARDAIVLDEDVDSVTGATYTSAGLTQAVQRAVHDIGVTGLGIDPPEPERGVAFGLPEIALIALFAVAVLRRRLLKGKASKIARWITLILGLIFLGFLFNAPFVLAHINMVLIGYWPDWQMHLYWYILIAGLLLFKARKDWNVYCYDFCPFGAAQDVLGRIGGAKSRRVRWPSLLLWLQRSLAIAAVSLALIYRNPGFSSFEIFGTLFSLDGSNFQFALLALVLLVSLFVARPWCRYLCPLHRNALESLFDRIRSYVRMAWRKIRPKAAA